MKILILTASYGSGHVIAAKALEEAFQEEGFEPVVFDLVLEGGRTERNAAAFYEFLMRRGHFVWRIFHDHIMPINQGNSIRRIYSLLHRKKFFHDIERLSPNIIVSTMDVASLIASLYAKKHPHVKIYTVLTDYVAHPLWVWQNMDRYFVGSEDARMYLVKHGILRDKIIVSGIPVRLQFTEKIDRHVARLKLKIAEDKKTILISAGSFGSISIETILRSIKKLDVFVLLLAGRKKGAVGRYADMLVKYNLIGKVTDYTDTMEIFMKASDLYISKAGGLTVAECFVCSLPAVYVNNFPGHEMGNALFAEKNNAAVLISDTKVLSEVVQKLLSSPSVLLQMRKNAFKLSKPNAATEIIRHILRENM